MSAWGWKLTSERLELYSDLSKSGAAFRQFRASDPRWNDAVGFSVLAPLKLCEPATPASQRR